MRRAAHNRIVVVLLLALAVLLALGTPALTAAAQPDAVATAEDAGRPGGDATDESVTDLPATGRGHGSAAGGSVSVSQTLTTALVLLAAAALALGGIAVLWRYERR